MKFPKSMHAEGWHTHIEPTTLGHVPKGLKSETAAPKTPKAPRADTRTRLDSPLGGTAVAGEARTPEPARRAKVSPWLIGAGAGVALIGLAVSMSHNLSSVEPAVAPPTVAAKTPQPAPTPSPEDTQLANAPTGAGPQQATPAAEPQPPLPEPKTQTVQAAPPVAKTLAPKPEAPVAQVAPPPRSEPAAKPTVTPATTPEATAPPVTQQPPQADPEDAGITIKVRAALAADSVLASVPIAVSTEHGIVKLEGQAPDAQAREHATVVVSSTAGVKGVDNRLTLPPVAQTQRQPGPAQQGG